MTIFSPLPLVVTTDATGPLFGFDAIDIDSDIFVPVDAGHVSGPAQPLGAPLPWALAKRANKCSATLFGAPIFSGHAERKEKQGRSGQVDFQLYSTAKNVFDCPPVAPGNARRFSVPAGTLAQIATAVAGSLGVAVAPGAIAFTPRANAVSALDGQTAWQILETLAEQAGAHLWVDELGVLHVENFAPYYAAPPVDSLLCAPTTPGGSSFNNVLDYRLIDDAGGRFSHLVVRGQGSQRAADGNAATGLLAVPVFGQQIDPDLAARGVYRPAVMTQGTARNTLQATNAAIRDAALRRVKGQKIEIDVAGWTTRFGVPWKVTQMVQVSLPAEQIAGVFFVAGRRFTRSKTGGTKTTLTLIEPGVLT